MIVEDMSEQGGVRYQTERGGGSWERPLLYSGLVIAADDDTRRFSIVF